jgi:hypothetical protein
MADAPDRAEVHRLVDLLPAGQVEALYILLRGMLPGRDEPQPSSTDVPPDEWAPDPGAPAVRTLSIAGIARGEHDLAERSQDILRRELGRQGE